MIGIQSQRFTHLTEMCHFWWTAPEALNVRKRQGLLQLNRLVCEAVAAPGKQHHEWIKWLSHIEKTLRQVCGPASLSETEVELNVISYLSCIRAKVAEVALSYSLVSSAVTIPVWGHPEGLKNEIISVNKFSICCKSLSVKSKTTSKVIPQRKSFIFM